MQYMWDVSNHLEEVQMLFKYFEENNIINPKEREVYFVTLMEKLGQKHCGATELNREELLKEVASKGQKALSIESENGKIVYKCIEPKEEKE